MASYSPKTWSDNASGSTPITAFDMNHIETGITSTTSITDHTISVTAISLSSGASFTITLPGASAGTLILHGTSGGAWDTVYVGAWATNPASTKSVITQIATTTTGPGNLFTSVTASTSSTVVTVQLNTPGSGCVADYLIHKAT